VNDDVRHPETWDEFLERHQRVSAALHNQPEADGCPARGIVLSGVVGLVIWIAAIAIWRFVQ
jgi:hypothetical protein